MFKMKPKESIVDMYTHFTDITNSLQSLGKEYTQTDQVRKILQSLTNDQEKKTTTIEEAKDLSTMTLQQLMGSLMAYKVQKNEQENQESNKHSITLKVDSSFEVFDLDEDLALIIRKFKKFLKKGKSFYHMRHRNDNKGGLCTQKVQKMI